MSSILVTGGAGFIGARLCARLRDEGHSVISLDVYFTGSKDRHVEGVDYREGHTKDIGTLVPERVDFVYHLGEYSRPEQSVEEPAKVFDLNMVGTFGVLEYCRTRQVRLVYAGSSTKFADGGLGRDQSPYAFTKATNSELVRNYGAWYGLPYAIAYFYNVYGPGELAEGRYATLVARFARLHAQGEPLTVTSPGTQRRIFTHVDDIVDGLLLIGEKGEGDEFGLGAEEDFSVLEVAKLFGGEIVMTPERAGNRMSAVLDASKSRAIGWSARRRLSDYVRELTTP